ncbi:MAG: hypothetical protein ACREP7_18305 [Lysobacter sp.]
MAKIPYEHQTGKRRGNGCKYPFAELRDIGDHFDAPAAARGSIQAAASLIGRRDGKRFCTYTLASGSARVILVEIDDGAR